MPLMRTLAIGFLGDEQTLKLKDEVESLKQQIKILRRDLYLKTGKSSTNTSIEKTDKIAELEELRYLLPDLRRLHKQNLEKASDTSLE